MGNLLTVGQAAERAGVSPGLVRAWVNGGELAHYRLGAKGRRGKIAIACEDLEAFLLARRVAAGVSSPAPAQGTPRGDGFSAFYQKIMDEVARKRR